MDSIPTIIQKQERLRAALQNQLYGTPMPSSNIDATPQTVNIEHPKHSRRALLALPVLGLAIIGGTLFLSQQPTLRGVSIKTPTATPTATITTS